MRAFFITLLGLIATVALSAGSPVFAQCRLCDQPSTDGGSNSSADDDIQLRIETALTFDRLILLGSGNGAVTMRPDGSSGAEGIVAGVGPRAMVGTILVHGNAGRAIRVEMPRRIELHSLGGGRMILDDVISDLSANPRLDAAGNLSFRFGGRLMVTGDADGQYRGDLQIDVEYQ